MIFLLGEGLHFLWTLRNMGFLYRIHFRLTDRPTLMTQNFENPPRLDENQTGEKMDHPIRIICRQFDGAKLGVQLRKCFFSLCSGDSFRFILWFRRQEVN